MPPDLDFGARSRFLYHKKSSPFDLLSRLDTVFRTCIVYHSNVNYLVPVIEVCTLPPTNNPGYRPVFYADYNPKPPPPPTVQTPRYKTQVFTSLKPRALIGDFMVYIMQNKIKINYSLMLSKQCDKTNQLNLHVTKLFIRSNIPSKVRRKSHFPI